jgi:hypothetical protein
LDPFDRAIVARSAGALVTRQHLLDELLRPAALEPGQRLGGLAVRAFDVEGDYLRLDLDWPAGTEGFAILAQPRRDEAPAFVRSQTWNIGYRGAGFTKDHAEMLGEVARRLDLGAGAAQLGIDQLRQRFFTRPTQDSYLEISPGKKLYIRVTDHCDEACVFCNATEGNLNVVESRTDAEAILRGMPVGALAQVIFSGGEPTLVKSLPRLVALACERGARDVIIQTNGVLLAAPGEIEKYLPYKDRVGIGFSLHATEPGLSAAMIDHPDEQRFPAKLRAIDLAVQHGFRVKLTCVVMRPNLAQGAEFVRWAWGRWGKGLTRVQLSYAMPRGNAWLNQHLLLKFSDCAPIFAEAFEFGRQVGLRVETSQSACPPPCLLPDYIDHYDLYGDFAGRVADPERVKPPEVCGGCQWERICAGVWKRYLDVFGTAEIKAITDRPAPEVVLEDYMDAEMFDLCDT